ncbi:AAA family ATPase [Rhodococcus opacus]|uniref:AAA family ATPase n=1 Tax=Rhodococcus opacus TaxID=37919 RepID=UPI000A5BD7FB|nr:AAA family ATPase [Rhodococcus opacus]
MTQNPTMDPAERNPNGMKLGDVPGFAEAVRAKQVSTALELAGRGWHTPEQFGAVVEALTEAGLHIGLVYSVDTRGQEYEKTPVWAGHCLTEEQRASPEYLELDAVELFTNDPARIATMATNFVTRFGKFPNLGFDPYKSRMVVADYDTPTQTEAFKSALRFGDRAAYAAYTGPTVETPGAEEDGVWKHSDGGHSYFVLPDGADGGSASVSIPGSGEYWVVIGKKNLQVLLPGSVRTEGQYVYTGAEVGVAGPWLLGHLDGTAPGTKPPRSNTRTQSAEVTAGDSAVDNWSRNNKWADLLNAEGWRGTGSAGCGPDCTNWKRPGGAAEKSATVHAEGCTGTEFTRGSDGDWPMYLFSTGHPALEGGRAYTKAQFMAGSRYANSTGTPDWKAFAQGEHIDQFHNPAAAETVANLTSAWDKQLAKARAAEFLTGEDFILNAPSTPPAWWGEGTAVLAARGEATMLCGTSGLGKTTIEAQLVRASIGLQTHVLGQPVAEAPKVLVLAMDRPAQIQRAFGRIFTAGDAAVLRDRLLIRPGPPPEDIAKDPQQLLAICTAAGLQKGDRLFVDSLKDAAIGLSEDGVGAAYNRARQLVLASGIDVFELHHMTKRSGDGSGGPPKALADVYGSNWLTAGAGSVFVLSGDAGDAYIRLSHMKQPMHEFGPMTIVHNHDTGITTADPSTDVVKIVAAGGATGMTAKDAAVQIFGKSEPTKNEIDKARRKLSGLAKKSLLIERPGAAGGHGAGRIPTTWTTPAVALESVSAPNAE